MGVLSSSELMLDPHEESGHRAKELHTQVYRLELPDRDRIICRCQGVLEVPDCTAGGSVVRMTGDAMPVEGDEDCQSLRGDKVSQYRDNDVCLPASRLEAVLNLRVIDDRDPIFGYTQEGAGL